MIVLVFDFEIELWMLTNIAHKLKTVPNATYEEVLNR
jgi:hypothetical protein